MHQAHLFARIFALVFLLFLSACGAGGGGGGGFALNGGPVAGAVQSTSAGIGKASYAFNVVADQTYAISIVRTSGSGSLSISVYNGTASGTRMYWNFLGSTQDVYSFISSFTGQVTIVMEDYSLTGSTYTLEAYEGSLKLGNVRSASTHSDSIYFDFDATAGTAYKVSLTPKSGDVNITAVNAKLTASVGSSALAGLLTDSVSFLAPASQRYYVQIGATAAASTFDIKVDTTLADPDLRVTVDSAVSDGKNVTINYTVLNAGINSAGAFDVAVWSNSTSAPTVGATGEGTASHAALAGGATVRGSVVVPNAGAAGKAYAVVDNGKAVAELDETNNASGGKAWEKPLIAPQNIGFESGTIPTALVMSGDAAWVVDTTTGSASTKSLKAGAVGNSQKSCVSLSAANAKSIKFDYAVSSEIYYDYLKFYIDGVEQWGWGTNTSGTQLWTSSTPMTVSSGAHIYTWCYQKSAFGMAGSDTAWIDNIVLTEATVDLKVVVNYAVSNGTSVNVNYTVQNLGNSDSGSFDVDVWSNAAAPTVGAPGEGKATHTSLYSGGSLTNTVTVPNASAAGMAYAVVDTQNVMVETDETNNVSAGYAWTSAVDLQVTVNSAVSDRNNVVVSYTVKNAGASAAGPFQVDVWSNSAAAPLTGTAGEGTKTYASLGVGQTVQGSVTVPNTGAGGTAYAFVDTPNAVAEAVETNNVSAGVPWKAPAQAPLTLNFENGLVPAEMIMSGDASWSPAVVGNGANARATIKAGTITHNQRTCVALSAVGSSSVVFDYLVSSETSWDFLRFYIDGFEQGSASGSSGWVTSRSFTVATGMHEFKWCYTKDAAGSAGSDTVWIDNIVIN